MGLDVASLDFFRSARDMSHLDKIEITLKICGANILDIY